MNQDQLNILLALVTNELIHSLFEVHNIREKVKRLKAYMDKQPYKELALKVDTRAKSYAITTASFFLFTLPLYFGYVKLDLDELTAYKLMVALLIFCFFANAYFIDKYHVEIEQITKKFKK